MLIITLYSATLTANLTVKSMKKPIDSINDLPDQDRYKYGKCPCYPGNPLATQQEYTWKDSKMFIFLAGEVLNIY